MEEGDVRGRGRIQFWLDELGAGIPTSSAEDWVAISPMLCDTLTSVLGLLVNSNRHDSGGGFRILGLKRRNA